MKNEKQVQEVTVSLSKAEEKMLGRLSPTARAAAQEEILASKRADKIAYLNNPEVQARIARDQVNRSVFGIKTYESGAVGVTGLGRKFPVALYKGEWTILLEHVEEIQAHLDTLPDEE